MKESCTNMYIPANNLKKALFVIVYIKMTSFPAGLPSFLIFVTERESAIIQSIVKTSKNNFNIITKTNMECKFNQKLVHEFVRIL